MSITTPNLGGGAQGLGVPQVEPEETCVQGVSSGSPRPPHRSGPRRPKALPGAGYQASPRYAASFLMISRRAALRVLAIAPAAAGTAILQGQAAPSEAAAPVELPDYDLVQIVPRGVPVAVYDGRLVWGDPDPARSEVHFGYRWPECWIVEVESPFQNYRVFKGVR